MSYQIITKMLFIILGIYLIICGLLFIFQEKLIFLPQKLNDTHQFSFWQDFKEMSFKMKDGVLLNGVLFKAVNSKGLIFYLHGNAGSLENWGEVAKTYTSLHYDVFMLDYRGYGKSDGSIFSEEQLFQDNQAVYDELKKKYSENKIIVIGYSIGTGMATKIASTNHPKLLILQAPYFSLTDLMKHTYPIIPTFILQYKLATNQYIKGCKMPIVVFHGDEDEIIYYGSSLKLKALFKPQDTLITLNKQHHNGITDNENYRVAIRKILMDH